MKIRRQLKIFGRVQGVGFRYYTITIAKQLALCGYVKNEDDDTVFVDVEGDEKEIETFTDYLFKGPSYSDVTDIKVIKGLDIVNFRDFEVRY